MLHLDHSTVCLQSGQIAGPSSLDARSSAIGERNYVGATACAIRGSPVFGRGFPLCSPASRRIRAGTGGLALSRASTFLSDDDRHHGAHPTARLKPVSLPPGGAAQGGSPWPS